MTATRAEQWVHVATVPAGCAGTACGVIEYLASELEWRVGVWSGDAEQAEFELTDDGGPFRVRRVESGGEWLVERGEPATGAMVWESADHRGLEPWDNPDGSPRCTCDACDAGRWRRRPAEGGGA